jgi:ferredoxin-NADP reductase
VRRLEGVTRADAPYLLVAGGTGITPVMSILRRLADEGDDRPLVLVYANRRWDDAAFRDELDLLADALDLDVFHVLADPPEGWTGESGRIDADLLSGALARLPGEPNVFVSGPPRMVDAALAQLRELGVADAAVHAERFASV